jgi:hypothetical protein
VDKRFVYLSFDADSAGQKIGRAILSNDPGALKDSSDRITLGNEIIGRWAQSHQGSEFSSGGDQGVWSIPEEAVEQLEAVRKDYELATGLTVSVGIGQSLSESGKALLVAKFRGKNQIVQYGPDVDQEIENAKAHVAEGSGTFEEQKLDHAYLRPEGDNMEKEQKATEDHSDCPMCAQMQDEGMDNSDCPMCAEMDSHDPNEEGHTDDCPMCAEMAHNPEEDGHPDDCPMCAEMAQDDTEPTPTDGPTVSNPTTTTSENYEGNGLNTPDMPKPDAISEHPDKLGTTFDTPSVENLKLQSEQSGNAPDAQSSSGGLDTQGVQTTDEILQEIDALPSDEEPLPADVANPDDADMAIGTNSEDNVSRPEGFEQNVPSDMGLSEDEEESPDMTQVLQEGLDTHADSIQRDKVISMVGEALEGFKACKDILERSKEQAPQLYQSSLMMLKAMIEMAKMLGLDSGNENGDNPLESYGDLPISEENPEAIPDESNTQGETSAPKQAGQ